MPAKVEGYRWINVLVREEVAEGLDELAARTRRGVQAEAAHAIERHLAQPPVVVTPPLDPVEVEASEKPKKRRGRPPKRE